ncbi:MAG: polysaccharide pyruvyl transferase family protein [Paludibacter sp.]|jgi:hypothetical protein|nr:polysaccharide pyruvyl transferase family protein [Paludibacter sp.]
MKIVILTLPFHINYGGVLQAYALQKVLKDMGHDVYIADLPISKEPYKKLRRFVGRIVRKYLFRKKNITRIYIDLTERQKEIVHKNFLQFINRNLKLTEKVTQQTIFKSLSKQQYDAYIVGSDQVWRPKYTSNISLFFLDFLVNTSNIKKIAYAASFGTDEWEYTVKETTIVSELAHKFNTISVREKSGIQLCKDKLGVDAEQMPDPTLLLTKEDYIELCNFEHSHQVNNRQITVVLLDHSIEKKKLIDKIEHKLQIPVVYTLPESKFAENKLNTLEELTFPSVGQWIKGFLDAEFVITDSFHGTVFAILFNKPFITFGNASRGMARFNSLLSLFELQDRLLLSTEEFDFERLTQPLNHAQIEAALTNERKKARSFLMNALQT